MFGQHLESRLSKIRLKNSTKLLKYHDSWYKIHDSSSPCFLPVVSLLSRAEAGYRPHDNGPALTRISRISGPCMVHGPRHRHARHAGTTCQLAKTRHRGCARATAALQQRGVPLRCPWGDPTGRRFVLEAPRVHCWSVPRLHRSPLMSDCTQVS